MAKELPYFQFEPAEYLSGDILLCSYEAQGVFVHLMAIYWQRDCQLTLFKAQRLLREEALNELIEEDVIKLEGANDDIIISFLDKQYELISKRKKQLSDAGKKGAEAKKAKATLKPPLSDDETPHKQPEEIKGDKKIEEEIIFNFKNSLLVYGFKKELVTQWLKVRKKKRLTDSEVAYNAFIRVVEKASVVDKNTILEKCVEKSWGGLEYDWLVNAGMIKASGDKPFIYQR